MKAVYFSPHTLLYTMITLKQVYSDGLLDLCMLQHMMITALRQFPNWTDTHVGRFGVSNTCSTLLVVVCCIIFYLTMYIHVLQLTPFMLRNIIYIYLYFWSFVNSWVDRLLKSSPWKARTHVSCFIKFTATDDLVMTGTRVSRAMVLTYFWIFRFQFQKD